MWRTFDLLAEHDLKEAEDREERRMQRQNKNFTDKIKKEESASACSPSFSSRTRTTRA